RFDDPEDLFTMPNDSVGTPQYLAPEVSLGQPATPQSDIYSLGATLWFLLTGKPPFMAASVREILKMHQSSPLPRLKKIRADIPDSLVQAIDRAMAKKPEDRFDTADQFAKVLRLHTINVGEGSMMGLGAGSMMAPGVGGSSVGSMPAAGGMSGVIGGASQMQVAAPPVKGTSRGVWIAIAALAVVVIGGGALGFAYLMGRTEN